MVEHIQIVGEIPIIGIGADAYGAKHWKPLQLQANEVDKEKPDPKSRYRLNKHQYGRKKAVDDPAATPGGDDAQQRAESCADEQRDSQQADSPEDASSQDGGDLAG